VVKERGMGFRVWGMGNDVASSVSDTAEKLPCSNKDFKAELTPNPLLQVSNKGSIK
jgi:hypothetical protein